MPPSPRVSFCIATFNRGPILIDCLHRIANNGLPTSAFEILVVDNASTDNTPALIAQHCPHVRIIRLPNNAGPVAKNLAIRASRGDFIILLDDDAYPKPGAVARMINHFNNIPRLAAAVFDVTLPDGSKEGSAYPDVFIGAGTGLRRESLESLPGGLANGPLPSNFFMQAEEYDLSFRLLNAGWSIQRFWDLPLLHLKTPGARIGQRTTRLDVRNNLYLLARYLPAPLCHELAADWLARYWRMATLRDEAQSPDLTHGTHKQSFIKGAAEGLERWTHQRQGESLLLKPKTIEQIFKFNAIEQRLGRAFDRSGRRRLILADLGKNMLAFWKAAQTLGLEIDAIGDDSLGGENLEYRGVKVRKWGSIPPSEVAEAPIITTTMSRVHAPQKVAALRRTLGVPVLDLFDPAQTLLHRPYLNPLSAGQLSS